MILKINTFYITNIYIKQLDFMILFAHDLCFLSKSDMELL